MFGILLQRYRLAAGLSQEELAERAGLSRRGISDLERGVRQTPHPATARQLAEALRLGEPEAAALRAAGLDRKRTAHRAQTDDGTPNNLLVQLTSFVGRQREQAEVLALLASAHLVTLTGSGGVGKTRLALEIGRQALESYADGVWLIQLDSVADPARVPEAIASTLSIHAAPGDVDRALAVSLRSRRLLLVLDNCEHVSEACATVAEHLLRTCPELRILATSREPLGIPAETTWPLDCLAVPVLEESSLAEHVVAVESVRLFVDRARALLPTFAMTPDLVSAIGRICRSVDGLPLGIELAATHVRVLSVQQIAERLEQDLDLLSSRNRLLSPRHQSLRAALNWSHALLSQAEQRLFEMLSVFSGGWTLEAAEFMTPDDALNALSGLVEKSLVTAHLVSKGAGLRYRMLEPVRQFARERLDASEASAYAHSRFVDYLVALGEEAEPNLRGGAQFATWLDTLQLEQDNLRSALRWCIAQGDFQRGLELGGAVWRLWSDRGSADEGREWLDMLLHLTDAAASPAFRARALNGAAVLACQQDDFGSAQAMLEECLTLFKGLGDYLRLADALHNLAFLAEHKNDFARARLLYAEALAIQVEHGDRVGEAGTLNDFAWSMVDEGDYARARQLSATAVHLYQELGDDLSAVWPRMALGWALLEVGDNVAAEAVFAETLAYVRECDWPPRDDAAPGCLVGLAATAASHGHVERAVRLAGAAPRIRELIGRPLTESQQGLGDGWLQPLQHTVDPASFEEWSRGGRALSIADAVVYALEPMEARRSRMSRSSSDGYVTP